MKQVCPFCELILPGLNVTFCGKICHIRNEARRAFEGTALLAYSDWVRGTSGSQNRTVLLKLNGKIIVFFFAANKK